MAAGEGSEIDFSVEEKMAKDTAASKGFNTVDDYVVHLLRQTPNWCGILYDKFAWTYRCEDRKSSGRDDYVLFVDKKVYGTRCEIYRNYLVSDCNATFDGKTLQFPDESHLNQKTYLSTSERLEVTAAMFGLTVKEYEDLRGRKIAEMCKGMSRDLEEEFLYRTTSAGRILLC